MYIAQYLKGLAFGWLYHHIVVFESVISDNHFVDNTFISE
jgi:hypothetical protein